jgi:vancomycin permeability regulator SanA
LKKEFLLIDGYIIVTLQDRPFTSIGVVFGTGKIVKWWSLPPVSSLELAKF